ncbi:MAG: class F sortase [Candidatus Saccharibacteria bacterium]
MGRWSKVHQRQQKSQIETNFGSSSSKNLSSNTMPAVQSGKRTSKNDGSGLYIKITAVFVFFFTEIFIMVWHASAGVNFSPVAPELNIPKKTTRITRAAAAPANTPPASTKNYPYQLLIPKLGINAPVLPLGVTANNEMAVPQTAYEVALFGKGPKPGQQGNVVLAGHYGAPNEVGVFRKLDKLVVGDLVKIKDKADKTYTYKVYKLENYNLDSAPKKEIFGNTAKYHLNLITCSGIWSQGSYSYDQRVIAFTELVP